jgi:hypothetical protein
MTFGAITNNLIRHFGQQVDDSPLVLDNIKFPNFSQVIFPDDTTPTEKKKMIKKMTMNNAGMVPCESLCTKTPKFSFKDIKTQHANDIKPIPDLIKDDTNSFITSLFQFHCTREQFCGWESATFISKYEAISTNQNANAADDDMSNATTNDWTTSKIDLFEDFEQINIDTLKAWAQKVWNSSTAMLDSQDGQSLTYAHKYSPNLYMPLLCPTFRRQCKMPFPFHASGKMVHMSGLR